MIRRHPILFGLLLLFIAGTVFFAVVYALGNLSGGKRSLTLADKVGVITVDGVITGSKDIVEQLETFGKDPSIKAVVLRIDSPGGGVAPSQEIFGAILELRKKKKVVASLGSIAASGGYLIACASDRIISNPGTITGSISAIMHFADVEELMRKVGVRATVIKSGKFKDIGTPARSMTDEERELLQDLVDDIYDQFLDSVATNRKLSKDSLRAFADGRVFTGRRAMKLGLVDELGDMTAAVRVAGGLAGIKGEPEVVWPPKKRSSLFDFLLQDARSYLLGALREQPAGPVGAHYLYLNGSAF
ncbi:MAG: signal peptide peptidase SppA [Syntrophaceae bacterium]|nr:signal peptide peptidase SppA [Syntrophaceae bacterium]